METNPTTLATEITDFVRGKTTDQNIAVQALRLATENCQSGKPWATGATTGHAGSGA